MKKLLFLFFAFCSLFSSGQNAAPSGTLSLIPSPAMYYRPADSTVHLYKGSAYLWNRFLTAKDSAKLAQPIFTATRIPFGAATGGKLTDNAKFYYDGSTLWNKYGTYNYVSLNAGLVGGLSTSVIKSSINSNSYNELGLTGGISGTSYFKSSFNVLYYTGSSLIENAYNYNRFILNLKSTLAGASFDQTAGLVNGNDAFGMYFTNNLTGASINISRYEQGMVKLGDDYGNTPIGISTWLYSKGLAGMVVDTTGKVGILGGDMLGYASNPTALLHITAGSSTSGNAPLKLTSGPLLTTPESGAIEYYNGKFAIRGSDSLSIPKLIVKSSGYGVGKVLTSNAYGELSYATPSGGSITSVATGLGLKTVSGSAITSTGTVLLDTANVSVLSRQRAANAYQPKGSYITLTSLSNTAPITYNNSSGAIGITQATTSTNGYLSSTDWNTFNGKTSNTGTVTNITMGDGLASTQSPLTTTGTMKVDTSQTMILSRQRAVHEYQPLLTTSTTANYLRGDKTWQPFITTVEADTVITTNKARRHYPISLATSSGLTLAANQVVGVDTASIIILSRQRAANAYQPKGAYNSGTGTLNYIPKYSATGSTLANSQIFDNGTFVGVGYSTDPTAQGLASKLAVNGNVSFNGIADIWLGTYSPALIGGSGTTSSLTLQSTSGIGATGANIYFKVGSAGGSIAQTIYNNGLIGIGTTATPTGKLMIGGGSTGGVPSLVIGSGTLLAGGATVAGAIENDGTHLYYTPVAAGTRFQLDNATMTATVGGMVPTPPNNTTTYLRGDGTFATPAAGGGTGTVTSVSVVTANGVSGTVATATTTPAITLTLGDITPSKVNTLYVDARKAGSAVGNNIWIGDGGRYSTGASASLGSYNTVSGWNAGISMTSSSFNTAYGYGSLANQTTGGTGAGNNTAVGSSSLGYILTGYNNVAIGSSAGAGVVGNSLGNYTSTNSVYIGINTVAGANGDDNEIVIGSSVIGSGSNTVTIGNSSVTKTVLNGQIVGLEYPYVAKATAYTLSVTDMMVEVTGAGTYNMTLPTAVGVTGKVYIIKKTGTSITQITTTSSQTIDGAASYNGLTSQFSKVTVMSNGTNWIIIG